MEAYKKIFSFLSFSNFIEYVIPAIILSLLLYFDVFITIEYSMGVSLALVIGKFSFFIIMLFIIGWLMYASRFYILFPGYNKRRKELYINISELVLNNSSESEKYRQAIGKYIFYQFWKKLAGEDHKHSLELHVKWVCIVHICNALMVSFLFIILLIVFKLISFDNNMSQLLNYINRPSLLILVALHPLLYFYLRFSGIRNLERSNANILDKINHMKVDIINNIPENIREYIEKYQ